MKILFNDIIQNANLNEYNYNLKSPSLAEITTNIVTANNLNPIVISFDRPARINAIGIGNTDGTTFIVNGQTINFIGNGLYMINEINTSQLTISFNGTYIGRLAAGIGIDIPTSIRKEPSYCSTANPRITLSGQVIHGAGGYNYKIISLDTRYKIDSFAMSEIENGYTYISRGYPFFIDLTDEYYKLPFSKFYGIDTSQQQMSFESGIRRFLYSRRFEFRECF